MIKPFIIYGCETWTLNSILEKSDENFARQILHTITGAVWDHNTNTWRRNINKGLLTETGESISHDMKARKLRWPEYKLGAFYLEVSRACCIGAIYKGCTSAPSRPQPTINSNSTEESPLSMVTVFDGGVIV
ncbi:unnamed protein product [Nezara viridula]|uniref:Uncharacterized protein n=1 Tax=Nezara viridula TaxID=85310 RepID=A0A9P0MR27_NEZVI|nr:unnamed protein product [Nezara viridula]